MPEAVAQRLDIEVTGQVAQHGPSARPRASGAASIVDATAATGGSGGRHRTAALDRDGHDQHRDRRRQRDERPPRHAATDPAAAAASASRRADTRAEK